MEHIDALEAVRRLTLERDALLSVVVERDALAEQVKQLSADLFVETYKPRKDALQATEIRETAETDAAAGEGGDAAPRGYNVPSWGKIARDVIWCASLALQNEIRLADQRKDWDELRRLQKSKIALDRIRDELSNIDDPALVV